MLDPLKLADEIERGELDVGFFDDFHDFCPNEAATKLIVHALRELGAKPAEVADDVRERVAKAIARASWIDTHGPDEPVPDDVWEDFPDEAAAALRVLRPGDVVPAGVVVPREPEITEELVGEMLNVFAEADPEDVKNLGHLAWAMGCSNGLIDSYMARGRLALAAVARRLAAIPEPPHAD